MEVGRMTNLLQGVELKSGANRNQFVKEISEASRNDGVVTREEFDAIKGKYVQGDLGKELNTFIAQLPSEQDVSTAVGSSPIISKPEQKEANDIMLSALSGIRSQNNTTPNEKKIEASIDSGNSSNIAGTLGTMKVSEVEELLKSNNLSLQDKRQIIKNLSSDTIVQVLKSPSISNFSKFPLSFRRYFSKSFVFKIFQCLWTCSSISHSYHGN